MQTGALALAIAAVFTGAAIYVSIAEQPVRLQLDNRSLLAEWKPSYKRGYMMQASLAIVGGLFGLVAYFSSSTGVGCSELSSCSRIGPTRSSSSCRPTGSFIDTLPEAATAETRRKPGRRGALHAGRSALALVATVIFLWARRRGCCPPRGTIKTERSRSFEGLV
jgi:hypothetical protein